MRLVNVPTANIAADPPVLLRERENDVAIPDVRNSLSEAMLIALSSALVDIAADNTVRAVVLTANGLAFSAGHDLKELTSRRSDADGGRAYFHHIMTTCSDMMQQIVNLPQPIIGAVQGVATAAGCQLVASCDLAVASRNARFATPGVSSSAAPLPVLART
jgi:enoyl-CoA hydratase/carnithine racemase